MQVPVGHMRNFSYVVADMESRRCAIVDPSWDLDLVYAAVEESGCRPRYIVNTHHHFDHTTGNEEAAAHTGAEIVRHAASPLGGDSVVSDGDVVEVGGARLDVLHTPGHSEDSICLVAKSHAPDGAVLTGDTLFVGGCGRVDLPGGSARALYRRLVRRASRARRGACSVPRPRLRPVADLYSGPREAHQLCPPAAHRG